MQAYTRTHARAHTQKHTHAHTQMHTHTSARGCFNVSDYPVASAPAFLK